ncbi:MAG: methylenetetrahydrofolate reductase [Deltaproteobacteria bacterium]|nr:methylenetetrahydrofolate reductase [Deltaproteobacteria bacterium]
MGRFSEKFGRGGFTTSVELTIPRGPDLTKTYAECEQYLARFDALNLTDSPMARLKINPGMAAHLIQQKFGCETIINFSCRDRNLIAIQSDLFGDDALGVRNLLLVTGDPPKIGDFPKAKAVFEFNSVKLAAAISRLNRGEDFEGGKINRATSFRIGVTVNPAAPKLEAEMEQLHRKLEAGGQFVISQPVYSVKAMERFLKALEPVNAPVILGILPLKSWKFAAYMGENVPEISVAAETLERLKKAGSPEAESRVGLEVVCEIAKPHLKRFRGVHVMPLGRVANATGVLDRLGL